MAKLQSILYNGETETQVNFDFWFDLKFELEWRKITLVMHDKT